MRYAHWYISTYVPKIRHGQKLSNMDKIASDMDKSDTDNFLYPIRTVNVTDMSENSCPWQIRDVSMADHVHGGWDLSMVDIKMSMLDLLNSKSNEG